MLFGETEGTRVYCNKHVVHQTIWTDDNIQPPPKFLSVHPSPGHSRHYRRIGHHRRALHEPVQQPGGQVLEAIGEDRQALVQGGLDRIGDLEANKGGRIRGKREGRKGCYGRKGRILPCKALKGRGRDLLPDQKEGKGSAAGSKDGQLGLGSVTY